MEMIDRILRGSNLDDALEHVRKNKGSAGIDGMPVDELESYFAEHGKELVESIRNGTYKPVAVKRVYIPKPNGKKRPLGIPTVVDRVLQQATAQQLAPVFEQIFSEYSYGFRPGRSPQQAVLKAVEYLNEGYEWIIDLDIEKFFDKVNQDKLISCIRKQVNESEVLGLIRKFLKAGVMENGVKQSTEEGTPQGGPLSPLLANIYLNEFDKELEKRGLRFVRYADDCIIFTRSEKAANRVMNSVTEWLRRKLFLKVSAEKTKVVRPGKSKFLGFSFWKSTKDGWRCKVHEASKARIRDNIRKATIRRKAAAIPLAETIKKVNQKLEGWINYYRLGDMKTFLKSELGPWVRHRIRVIILKQWKRRGTMIENLWKLNRKNRNGFTHERIFAQCMTRTGWYRLGCNDVVNFILNPRLLYTKTEERPSLVDPLEYYLAKQSC